MKYYAHYGHKDFILCLGYGAHKIKEFFLRYDEWATNDFVLADGGRSVEMLGTDIDDWRITFVDTGTDSNIGERLRRVQPFLGDDEVFLANYADGLSDLPLDAYVDDFLATRSRWPASSASRCRSRSTSCTPTTTATSPASSRSATSRLRINAGFFVLRREIFEYMNPGEELVVEPFRRLVADQAARWPTPTTASGGRWTRSRTSSSSTASPPPATPPWQVWSADRADP